jgi:TolB-like protein/Tfp pilus assembly protein PilF
MYTPSTHRTEGTNVTSFGHAANQPERTTGSGHPVKSGYRFGRYTLDLRAHELLKDGVRIRLQDQPFEVLVMLLQQPGEVLTREELRRRLWPDGTFVDFEHGLNAAVKRLRSVLGDSADNPRFVETLHRRGYRFIAEVERIGNEEPSTAAAFDPAAAQPKLRLAVLPFTDLGERTASHAYFSEGLTEEMITQLGRLCANRLGVVARTSSTLVVRNASTAQDIGRVLRADYLVEGSVRRDGDRVRVSAQLVETRGETQLWAQSYERHLSDCFTVQSEVATEIVHSLAMELLPDTEGRRGSGTRNVAAHQAYLKGRYHWNRTGSVGLREAIAYFDQALSLDPEFSAAYAALARAQISMADYYVCEPREALEAGRTAAARAIELDPSQTEAWLTIAEVRRSVDWNWVGAEDAYKAALATNPSHEGSLRYYGMFLATRGRTNEAMSAARRAQDLDPMCLTVNTSAAWVDYITHDYARAIETCRHTLDMDPEFAPANRLLAASLLQMGRTEEAVAAFERVPNGGLDTVSVAWLAHLWGVLGERRRADTLMEWLRERGRTEYVSGYHVALAHTGLGDMDRAFASLSAACEARDPGITNLAAEPRFAPLREDRRFGALVGRLLLQE